jgi:hypothetical protein
MLRIDHHDILEPDGSLPDAGPYGGSHAVSRALAVGRALRAAVAVT